MIGQWPGTHIALPAAPRRASRSRLEDVEKDHIRAVVEAARWRIRGVGGAADKLGLKPTTLETRWRNWGLSGHAYRGGRRLAPGVLGLKVEGHMSALDQLIPDPHLVEVHRVRIAAPDSARMAEGSAQRPGAGLADSRIVCVAQCHGP